MIFGKYINKYYRKYAIFFIIGVAALILVDVAQLFVPQFLGNIVDILSDGTITAEDQSQIIYMIIATIVVAAVMMLGRFLWRVTIFTKTKLEPSWRGSQTILKQYKTILAGARLCLLMLSL